MPRQRRPEAPLPSLLSGFHGDLAELAPEASPEFLDRVLRALDKASRLRKHRHLLEPEDAVQELLAWLLEHPEQLREWSAEDRSPGYLWTVFRNRAVSIIRARHGRRPAVDPESLEDPVPLREEAYDPEDLELLRVGNGVAPSAEDVYLDSRPPTLPGISAEEMGLLLRHHVEGWSAPELAAEIGITPAAMRQRLSRARERVRAAVSHSRRSVPMFFAAGPSPETQDEDEDHGTADRGRAGAAAA